MMLKRNRGERDGSRVVAAGDTAVRPWTVAETDLLRDLVAKECRLSDIAAGLGRSVADCRSRLDSRCSRPLPSASPASGTGSVSEDRRAAGAVEVGVDEAEAAQVTAARSGRVTWSLDDDLKLSEYVETHGPQWTLIRERYMPQRTIRSMQRRWALIESLALNAAAASRIDATPHVSPLSSQSPAPQLSLEQVLRQYHAMGAKMTLARDSHQRIAAAFNAGTFPGAPSLSSASLSSGYVSRGTPSQASSSASAASLYTPPAAQPLGVGPSPAPSPPAPLSPRTGMKRPLSTSATPHSIALAEATEDTLTLEIPRDMTGDQLVDLVKNFVERHATYTKPAPAAAASAMSEDRQRAAVAASVDSVLAHLDIHRPFEIRDRVALEVAHRQMAASTQPAPAPADPIVPRAVRDMDCAVHGAASPPPAAFDTPAPFGELRGRSRPRPPEADEVQAMVAMHIHQTVEASSIGSSVGATPYMPGPSRSYGATAPPPAAGWRNVDEDHAAAAARASTAAFFASWANLEVSGSLHNQVWSNVFEPPRCALRTAVPRALAFLPCLYVTFTGASCNATPAHPPAAQSTFPSPTEAAGSLARALCPLHAADRLCVFVTNLRAALPAMSDLCPFARKHA